MAHREKEHPLVGYAFLALVAALLFFAAKAGLEASRHKLMIEELKAAAEVGDNGELEKSEAMLEKVAAQYPNSPEAAYMLGVVRLRAERLEEADKAFTRALELDPQDWDAVAERATIAKIRGDIETAVAMLEKIPAGHGHVYDRMRDSVWIDVRGDERMRNVYNKHRISLESGVKESY